jgi:RimJ/RimL family protein N-acetyltransferase
MTFIETARLALRKMTPDDADNLLGIFQNPVAMRYYRNSKDRAETLDWIDWNLRGYREDGIGLWIVELRDSGQFVGQCGLTMQEVEGVREPEVGYLFLQEAWGKGYTTKAAACLDYGFTRQGYPRIICLPAADNHPSRRVAERVGMTLERELIRRGKKTCVYVLTNGQSLTRGT